MMADHPHDAWCSHQPSSLVVVPSLGPRESRKQSKQAQHCLARQQHHEEDQPAAAQRTAARARENLKNFLQMSL